MGTRFGSLSIVWLDGKDGPRVRRVFLPNDRVSADDVVRNAFPGSMSLSCGPIRELSGRVQRFLNGEAVEFDTKLIELEKCPQFQRKVLRAERRIPRGWVSTYGRIARSLGVSNGARAVGRALSLNPFPIIIPCHRAVKSDGTLGGFQGGLDMKRELLVLEGIEVSPQGGILTGNMWYEG